MTGYVYVCTRIARTRGIPIYIGKYIQVHCRARVKCQRARRARGIRKHKAQLDERERARNQKRTAKHRRREPGIYSLAFSLSVFLNPIKLPAEQVPHHASRISVQPTTMPIDRGCSRSSSSGNISGAREDDADVMNVASCCEEGSMA